MSSLLVFQPEIRSCGTVVQVDNHAFVLASWTFVSPIRLGELNYYFQIHASSPAPSCLATTYPYTTPLFGSAPSARLEIVDTVEFAPSNN